MTHKILCHVTLEAANVPKERVDILHLQEKQFQAFKHVKQNCDWIFGFGVISYYETTKKRSRTGFPHCDTWTTLFWPCIIIHHLFDYDVPKLVQLLTCCHFFPTQWTWQAENFLQQVLTFYSKAVPVLISDPKWWNVITDIDLLVTTVVCKHAFYRQAGRDPRPSLTTEKHTVLDEHIQWWQSLGGFQLSRINGGEWVNVYIWGFQCVQSFFSDLIFVKWGRIWKINLWRVQ